MPSTPRARIFCIQAEEVDMVPYSQVQGQEAKAWMLTLQHRVKLLQTSQTGVQATQEECSRAVGTALAGGRDHSGRQKAPACRRGESGRLKHN